MQPDHENRKPIKFRGKYRIESARLKNYDYSSNGAYFITICTKNREHFFGEIVDGNMQYSGLGNIAQQCWQQIPDHFPFVILDAWIIMPNHVHGILIFNKQNGNTNDNTNTENKFGPQSKNLASVTRGFKIGVTKYARENTDIYYVWQPRFHDHIVRNENELNRIRKYIFNNPANWKNDRNHKAHIVDRKKST